MTLHFKKLLLGLVIIVLANTNCWALEINPDGRTLIQEASLAYASDMKGRPVVTEPVINEYLSGIARKLFLYGKAEIGDSHMTDVMKKGT